MKFIYVQDTISRAEVYQLRIEDHELEFAPLDTFDLLLLKECGTSSAISDKLLALKTIARRIEETKP